MAIKMKVSRYELANFLRVAAEKYDECARESDALKKTFLGYGQKCYTLALQLEDEEILGDCIVLED